MKSRIPIRLTDRLLPAVKTSSRARREALEARNAELAEALHEAELDLAIQSSASRILAFALACSTEEEDPVA